MIYLLFRFDPNYRHMQNRLAKIFVIITIAIISIPFVFTILKIKVTPVNKQEKEISLNFKRNFPLKSDLFKIYSLGKTTVFDAEPIPYSVVDVKNGWKFLGNKFSNALAESKGLLVFNKSEILQIKQNILERKKWLEQRNIKFYIAVAPSKHTIYGDMIPIRKSAKKTKFEQIDSLCKSIGVKFIDLGADFPRKDSLRLYDKTDSHWNHFGGFFAYKTTMNVISNDYKNVNFNRYTLDDMNIEVYRRPLADLNRMLFQVQNEEFIDVQPKKPYTFVAQEKKLTPPSDYRFGYAFYEERYKSEVNDLKILALRDSFFGAFSNLIADNFGTSVFVWRHTFNKELIESEKPDIVLYEVVERNIDIFLSRNFVHAHN